MIPIQYFCCQSTRRRFFPFLTSTSRDAIRFRDDISDDSRFETEILCDGRIKRASVARERDFLRLNSGKRVNIGTILVFVALLTREAELYFRPVYALKPLHSLRGSRERNADNEEHVSLCQK